RTASSDVPVSPAVALSDGSPAASSPVAASPVVSPPAASVAVVASPPSSSGAARAGVSSMAVHKSAIKSAKSRFMVVPPSSGNLQYGGKAIAPWGIYGIIVNLVYHIRPEIARFPRPLPKQTPRLQNSQIIHSRLLTIASGGGRVQLALRDEEC